MFNLSLQIAQVSDWRRAVDIFYQDFVKAFHLVSHRLLLTKFRCYGVDPSGINWNESFLRRRFLPLGRHKRGIECKCVLFDWMDRMLVGVGLTRSTVRSFAPI